MLEAPVTIRFAHAHDAAALAGLAQLDSSAPLAFPILVAEIDGYLRAALSLADTAAIADPFHPSGELVDLLRIRARQLAGDRRRELRARVSSRWRLRVGQRAGACS